MPILYKGGNEHSKPKKLEPKNQNLGEKNGKKYEQNMEKKWTK